MAKKAKPAKPAIVSKILRIPSDWIERIDKARGSQSFSEFVRAAILEKIGAEGLSDVPSWGGPRG